MLRNHFNWNIGNSILQKQKEKGWGKKVIEQLSKDLTNRFPNDRGYSIRNLKYMRQLSEAYPDFPILQVPLAQITWYHHISLLSKLKDDVERAYYITETAHNGWIRDVMMMQIGNGYINAKGHAIHACLCSVVPTEL